MGEVFTRRIFGVETEYGITATHNGRKALGPEEVARYLFRPIVAKYASSNIFTESAARLYLDVGSHPEFATAECDGLTQLLNYERSGDLIMDRLARRAEEALAADGVAASVYLFKNNVDSVGNSYGCHENYLISRSMVLKTLGRQLLPFMITRQLICGAGKITRPTSEGAAEFVLSQRADQVWEGVSSATTRSRPIINTRDEPHADSDRYRRMHVIVGDSNMAEPTFALKVGATLLVLEMLEAGFNLPDFEIEDPIAYIREIARDTTGRTVLTLKNGTTVTALEIQTALCSAAERWLEQRPNPQGSGTTNTELRRVLDLWQRTLTALETQDFSLVNTEIDWVIKHTLLQRYRERLGGEWSAPKLAQLDLAYHDIRPGRGLADLLVSRGMISRWTTDAAIEQATQLAPPTTRARLRGEFLQHAHVYGVATTVDWLHLKVNGSQPQVIELGDPFTAVDKRVDELIAAMAEIS